MKVHRLVHVGVALAAFSLLGVLPASAQDKSDSEKPGPAKPSQEKKVAPEALDRALDVQRPVEDRSIVKCPDRQLVQDTLKTLSKSVPRVRPSAGSLPPDCAEVSLPANEPVYVGFGYTRGWDTEIYNWTAPGLGHLPIYFEDLPLERYGQQRGLLVQPVVSAAKFFAVFPTLPYQMALDPPRQPICTLGYDRPGNCTPFVRHRLPFSPRAAVAQAGVTAGLILLIP